MRSLLVLSFGIVVAACGAGQGGGNHDGSGGHDGTGMGTDAGFTTLPDGRVVPNDGGNPGMDGGGQMDSGTFVPPDGSTIDPDTGVITLPDGAMVLPDGATVTDSGTPPGDGGSGCGSAEICNNGMDDNCNGQVDEGCPCLPGATQQCYDGLPSQAGIGVCNYGMETCTGSGEFGTWSACVGAGHPQPVVCGGGMDYRCDGMIDEGCGCPPGATRACYSGPAGTSDVGLCHGGTQMCIGTGSTSDWGPCTGEVTPTPELCDGMDHDCDGMANTGCGCTVGTSRSCYDGPAGTAGVGLCHAGSQSCMAVAGGASWSTCSGEVTPTPDTCDGLDHTCTGMTGVGCACIIGATQPCYTGPTGSRHVGVCRDGSQTCVAMGSSAGWGAMCTGQTTPAAMEICGNMLDDNCNGAVDEGCGGMIVCPGNQNVDAGTPITLTVTGSGLTNYVWTIVSGPTGGGSTAVWAPNPPTSATEVFTPYIVGTYVISVSATDSGGHTVSCMFQVTALPHGLRVQLTWNGSGDVDLHLHDQTATPWFHTGPDCYYANTAATWGANLDFDNTTANGPENISMNTPVIGTNYTVGVHNYAAAAGRIATIQIFCGSTMSTLPTQTFTSHALVGTGSGQTSSNDFWKVATVRFTSPTACTITPLNTYVTANAAYTAF